MRVIAGSARRLILKTIPGDGTRPTTDRIKETLFNILQNDIPGIRFLDLFAGSGGIGIEALSRGAAEAVFVDKNKEAVSCIKENLLHTRLMENARVLNMDVLQALRVLESDTFQSHEPFHIIFMDPPYKEGLERAVLESLKESTLCTEDTLIIVEADLRTDFSYLPEIGFTAVRFKEYKTNKHVFIRRHKESSDQ